MKLDKILKVIAAVVAIIGILVAIYFVIKKFAKKPEPEYFEENDFFECDNDLEFLDEEESEEQEENVTEAE